MFSKISDRVLKYLQISSSGITSLDVLKSMGLCSEFTLKTTLSRLNRSGRIIRLKRGVYSTNPMRDALVCAQNVFNGYIGFSTALYVHKLVSETPFTVFVVTYGTSGAKRVGEYEFKGVSLKGKAVGFERKGNYVVSTRPKTLFDCLYLPRYAVEYGKLMQAFKQARLTKSEWREFDYYSRKLASGNTAKRMQEAKKLIGGN